MVRRKDSVMENSLHIDESKMSYVLGLFKTDGNLYEQTRNRGRISFEVSIRDEDIVDKLIDLFDGKAKKSTRVRKNYFKKDEVFESVTLRIYDLNIRNEFKNNGMLSGKKSYLLEANKKDSIIKKDYVRGLIDGDGSIGFTKNLFPFVSFVTASESLAKYFLNYLKEITGKDKSTSRNKRDNVFNIMVTKEDAVNLVKNIYYDSCLSIDRKNNIAKEIIKWERPKNMLVSNKKKWTEFEDDYILTHSIKDSMKKLNRTEKSISCRLFRVKNRNNN